MAAGREMSASARAEKAGSRTLCWVAVSVVACIALLGSGATFETDDDPAMEGLLSGRSYGRPFDAVFLGHNLSSLLMRCYSVLPGVPWYGLFLESVTVGSTILWTLLIVRRIRRPLHVAAALAGFFAAHQYLLLRLNFMGTALSLFLVSAAWLVRLQVEEAPLRWQQVGIGLAMGLAYMVRPTLGQLVLFFSVPCLAVSFNRRAAARLAYVAAVAGVFVVWTELAGSTWRRIPANRVYEEFNSARAAFVDRPHTCTQEALDAAGWSHTDYRAAMQSWFYDEKVFPAERFHRFLSTASRGGAWARRTATAGSFFFKPYHLLCLAVLLCCPAFLWLDGACREGAPARGVHLLIRAGVWAWLCFGVLLLMAHRLPPRAYVPIYCYLAVLTTWLPVPLPGSFRRRCRIGWTRMPATVALAGIMLFAAMFRARAARAAFERDIQLERDFVAALPAFGEQTLFVPLSPLWSDASRSVFALPAARPRLPLLSSGWLLRSPAYHHRLREFGYDTGHGLLSRASTDPRVVFVVNRKQEEWAVHVERHLNQHVPEGEDVCLAEAGRSPSGMFLFYRLTR